MRFNLAVFASLLVSAVAAGIVDPAARAQHAARVDEQPRHTEDEPQYSDLWKRKGGGGGGGRGGGGGGGSKGGSKGSSNSGGGSGNRGGGGSKGDGKGYNTKSDSNTGGYSRGGTGPQPNIAGFYAGGAAVPFAAGAATPSGMKPRGPAPVGYWPGYWYPGPIYVYGPYGYSHHYYNKTSHKTEDREIICGCAQYSVCMCDEVKDKKFWDKLLADGDYKKLNKSVVTVTKVDRKEKIVINGTLPNGTTVDSDDPEDYEKYLTNTAVALAKTLGLWPAIAAVTGAVFLL